MIRWWDRKVPQTTQYGSWSYQRGSNELRGNCAEKQTTPTGLSIVSLAQWVSAALLRVRLGATSACQPVGVPTALVASRTHLVPGLDGCNEKDKISNVLGPDVGDGGKLVRGRSAACLDYLMRAPVDSSGILAIGDNFPPLLGVGIRLGELEGFALRVSGGDFVDDLRYQPPAVLRGLRVGCNRPHEDEMKVGGTEEKSWYLEISDGLV